MAVKTLLFANCVKLILFLNIYSIQEVSDTDHLYIDQTVCCFLCCSLLVDRSQQVLPGTGRDCETEVLQ